MYNIIDPTGKEMTISADKMLVRGQDYHADGIIDEPQSADHAAHLLREAGIINFNDEEFDEENDYLLAQQELEDFAQDGVFENMEPMDDGCWG